MTLDVINLDKIWTVNSMWENKQSKVVAALVWNLYENQDLKNFNFF